MKQPNAYFVFDVESVGLHGEAFFAGWTTISPDGAELCCGIAGCSPDVASGDDAGRAWVAQRVKVWAAVKDTVQVRRAFWRAWEQARGMGAVMAADCPWPVEARFLLDCIADEPGRAADGPYPLIDVASVRLAAGLDPLGTEPRRPEELPVHDPLADARQSARLLIEALDAIRSAAA